MEQDRGSGPGTPGNVDSDAENPDGLNKMRYHASKMDLNLRILRDQMTNLRDTGDTLSRQMASMYRNFQKVKEDDQVSDEGDTGDSGDEMMRDKSCVDTEDDVNQMTDLDADESSISSRKGPLPQGQLANLQRRKAAGNIVNNKGRPRGQNNVQRGKNMNSRDPNENDVSSEISTTRNRELPQSGMDGDIDDDEDTLSESECSGNCLCCSSIASYQGIPWTIRRPSSAETTDYESDSSELDSDYEDDRYRSKRAPLHARLSPFFHQDTSHSDSSSPLEEEARNNGKNNSLVKRMSPLGCESPSQSDGLPESKKEEKSGSPKKGSTGGPPKTAPKPGPKPAPKPAPKPPPKPPARSPQPKSRDVKQSGNVEKPIKKDNFKLEMAPVGKKEKPSRQESKKEKASNQEVSLSEAVALGAVARADKSGTGTTPPKKSNEEHNESSKHKPRHVSKTAIVLLDPEAEFKDGDTIKKRSNILPAQQPIEVPLSYVDKHGCITLTPDPKLAPEAYKAGKTITFRVRAASESPATNPDGPLTFTPTYGTKPTVTVTNSSTADSPPVSIAAEEIGHEHQIQVTPEGIIRLSKRKPVPMQVFMPQFQQHHQQQPSSTITLNSAGGTTNGDHSACPSCHRKVRTTAFVQPQQPSNLASNVRVIRMSPGITASPVSPQPQPQPQGRVHVIQRQTSSGSSHGSPPTERQQIIVHQEPGQRQHIVIKRQEPGQMSYQVQPEQQYQQVHQQVEYPQDYYQQQGYTQHVGYPQHPQQQVYQQGGYSQQVYPQIRVQQGDGISIPIQPGTQTIRHVIQQPSGHIIQQPGHHIIQQPSPHIIQHPSPHIIQQPMQQTNRSGGVATIRFGDGAPIKVTPGQGMRFVINPK